jgi:antitoxin MazE
MAMKTRIVRIGNSQGIRIPKPLLEQTGLRDEVEVSVQDDGLMIRPARKARTGWADAFREMARRGDDAPLDDAPPSLSSWDEDEWEW